LLETRIVWKEPFKAVGQKIRYEPNRDTLPSKNEISELWLRFNPRSGEIQRKNGECYGLCLTEPGMKPGDPFDYIAAVGVSEFVDVPEGMIAETFAGGLYAVVKRQGRIDEIGQAYQYYYDRWLPNSEFTCREGAEFEYYDNRYLGNDNPESVMELWFPVRRQAEWPIENRIASVFLHVSDLRRSAEWYSRLLGLSVREERLNGGPVYWLDLPGTGLVLDSNANNRLNPNWREEMKPLFMLSAKNIDEAYAFVRERAETFFEPERHPGMAYFNFRDTEGNTLMACWSEDGGQETGWMGDSPISARIGGAFVDVTDMRRAAAWYSDLFGTALGDGAASGEVCSVPMSRGAALLLDLHRHLRHEAFSIRCMFDAKDIRAAYAYASDLGLDFRGGLEDYGNIAFFTLKDPDGNLVMVCQSRE